LNNSVGNILRKIGFINMFAGVVLGFILGDTHNLTDPNTNWGVVLLWAAIGFISGMTFIGFSEIIYLLQGIYIDRGKNESNSNLVKSTGKADIYNSILNNNDTNV
jgi:hypothetical protein